jgi:hypothetical protein
MDVPTRPHAEGGERGQETGALVVLPHPAGGVTVEIGAADGQPVVRFPVSTQVARRFAAAIQQAASRGGEGILLDGE